MSGTDTIVSEERRNASACKERRGLGLSIVKGVLEMHRLNFGADSTVGVGSTFWFEFEDCNPNKVQVDEKKRKSRRIRIILNSSNVKPRHIGERGDAFLSIIISIACRFSQNKAVR